LTAGIWQERPCEPETEKTTETVEQDAVAARWFSPFQLWI